MKLSRVVGRYVRFKRALGMSFRSEAAHLKYYWTWIRDVDIRKVRPEQVFTYLMRRGLVTTRWHYEHSVLTGFYRFAISRGYAARSPLPTTIPQRPETAPPYIYTTEELQRLLDATPSLNGVGCEGRGRLFRTLLLTLYGAGLRISEALRLEFRHVDFVNRTLLIKDTKFYKTRLVPIGPRLAEVLSAYLREHAQEYSPASDAILFPSGRGGMIKRVNAEQLFKRLRELTGVVRRGEPGNHQPRLHDIRHTSAVHRLIAWYKQGLDVQRLLPRLSVYLGHVDIASTQRYLTLTPELLEQANRRFERYALSEDHHG